MIGGFSTRYKHKLRVHAETKKYKQNKENEYIRAITRLQNTH